MNKTVLIIIGVVAALGIGIGAVFFILSSRSTPAPVTTPSATPIVQAPLSITVTPVSTTLSASASGSFDIFLNTNGVKIDGFQFIANLDGAGVNITDADPATAGVQISPAAVTGLNQVTNSVLPEGTAQVIRFAMITQNAGQPFSSTSPIKVATVNFVPTTTGTIKLDFNTQNTRANKTGTTEDTLITANSTTFTVGSTAASTPAPIAASTGSAISCNAACLTDNDCSVGLACVSNSCINNACPTSATCSCTGTTTVATKSATTVIATPKPTATPKIASSSAVAKTSPTPRPTATPVAIASPKVATIAALPASLPKSGSVENTFILIGSGLSLMTLAAFFMLRSL